MSELDPLQTRSRLLQAAGEVFAEVGYREATVREICARAGANIAGVNYHFGGKDELYAAVLEQHFADNVTRFPIRSDLAGSPEGALHEFVRISLERMLSEDKPAWHAKLTLREITEPTPHFDTIAERFMKPHFGALRALVDRLTGPGVPEERRRLLALSGMGQIVFYKIAHHAVKRITPEQGTGPEDRVVLARHITEVLLAAARDLRERYGAGASTLHSPEEEKS